MQAGEQFIKLNMKAKADLIPPDKRTVIQATMIQ